MTELHPDTVKHLIATGQQLAQATVRKAPNGIFHLVTPETVRTQDISKSVWEAAPRPRRKRGTVKLLSLASFADFANRYKEGQERTVVFANTQSRVLTVVFNYHEPTYIDAADLEKPKIDTAAPEAPDVSEERGDSQKKGQKDKPDQPDEGVLLGEFINTIAGEMSATMAELLKQTPRNRASWGDFRAQYEFPLSRQWKIWTEVNKRPMGQLQLAGFLEDNIRDIADPAAVPLSPALKTLVERLGLSIGTPAKLLETARGFELRANERTVFKGNTTTGEALISYEKTHENGSNPTVTDATVPTALLLTIPVFENGAPYLLLARLRHRSESQTIKWIIDIQSIDATLEDAFNSGCRAVIDGDEQDQIAATQLPLIYGVEPESCPA